MCEPATMLAIGMAAASAGMSYMGIQSQNDAAEASAHNAVKAAENDYMLLDLQQTQAAEKTALDKFERERQGMRETARIRAAGSESGAFGNSLLRQISNSMFQTDYDQAIMEQGLSNQVAQSQAQKTGVQVTAEGRLNDANSQVTSGLMSALKIGQAGVGGYASGQSLGNSLFSPSPSPEWTFNSPESAKTGFYGPVKP